jgi:hypothetical protein
MLLTRLIPEAWRPWAKTVVALVIGVIGLLVSTLIIDSETGSEWTQAITSLAMLLGVYEAANVSTKPEDPAVDPGYTTARRSNR